jgi:hypothetical protein
MDKSSHGQKLPWIKAPMDKSSQQSKADKSSHGQKLPWTKAPAPFDRQTNAKENPEMQSYYHQAAVGAIAAEEPIWAAVAAIAAEEPI